MGYQARGLTDSPLVRTSDALVGVPQRLFGCWLHLLVASVAMPVDADVCNDNSTHAA